MSRKILILILSEKIGSIGRNAELNLSLVTTPPPTPRPTTPEDRENAISVVLKNFQADKVRYSKN